MGILERPVAMPDGTVQMIKKGATPAAVLTALGYSTAGMAAEVQEMVMDALRADSEGSGDLDL